MTDSWDEISRRSRRPVPRHLPGNIGKRYRVLSLLGSGGVGEVVEAYDLKADRPVALKVLKREAARDKRTLERFFREANALGRLAHPSIVKVYETGQDERGLYFIAMEMIIGRSLKERLREEGRMNAADAARLGAEVCEVMHVAHAMQIIHRDLKPSNLILPEGWERNACPLKVVDFGIAKILFDRESPRQLTASGDLVGTPRYMSPEQARGHEVDGRADLYALGCILYECLSGHVPFGGPDHFAMLLGHMEREPVRIDALVGADDVPRPLADFIHTLLAKQPDQRPVNAAAAEAVLRQLSHTLPTTRSARAIPTPEDLRARPSTEPSFAMGALPDAWPANPEPAPAPRAPAPRAPASPPPAPTPPPVPAAPPLPPTAPRPAFRRAPDPTEEMPDPSPTDDDPWAEIAAPRDTALPTVEADFRPLDDGEDSPRGRAALGLGVGALGAALLITLTLAALALAYVLYHREPTPKDLAASDPKPVQVQPLQTDAPKADPPKAAPPKADPPRTDSPPESWPQVDLRRVEIVTDPPGAEILRGGKPQGVAPLTLGVEDKGQRALVYLLRAPGREARYVVIKKEDFQAGLAKANVTLPPLAGRELARVELHTEPSGAEVYDGDSYIGLTPLLLALPTARQAIKLRLVGDGERQREVWVALQSGSHILKVDMTSDADPLPE
jgi:serine/threonine protein kinase